MSASSLHRESTDSLIGMVRVGEHRSHTFGISVAIGTQSGIRHHERVYTYGQNMGVLIK